MAKILTDQIHLDTVKSTYGTGSDLQVYHDGSNSYIKNSTGDVYFQQNKDDGDVYFQCDNGSGGTENYLHLDGSSRSIIVTAALGVYHNDGIAARFGNSGDLQLYHNGTDSVIENANGDLYITNKADGKDIIFRSDDGSGGFTPYFKVDSASQAVTFVKPAYFTDNVKAQFGNSSDLKIYHDLPTNANKIESVNSRQLQITQDNLFIGSQGATESFITAVSNGAVSLYYDNSKKFETTSTGATITGTITSTGKITGTELEGTSLDINGSGDISGNLTVTGINYGIYHAVVDDQYYFDDYNGSKNLNIFYKNTRSDFLRYRQVDNYEYWNGSAWVADSSKLSSVKNLLDGRQDTSYSVPARDYKFRFTTSSGTAWPTMAMIWMQTSWTGSTYPGGVMTVEHLISGTWTTKVTAEFTSVNGNTNWGTHARADTALHDGSGSGTNTTRITIDFYGWTPSSSSYTTIPLQNLMITSNFSGTENTDYTNLLDYDRTITCPNNLDLPDDKRIRLGNQDLQIFHSSVGTGSFIQESGPGSLEIYSDTGVNIKSGALGENFAKFTKDGPIELYYDNSKKFETTSTGVTITGSVTSTGGSRINNGTASSPAYSFTSDTNTGMNSTSSDTLSLVTGGTTRMLIGNTTVTFSGTIIPDAISFAPANATSDPDKFLCVNGGGLVQYRTGAQVLSDIGASTTNGTVTSVSASTSTNAKGLSVSSGTTTPVVGLDIVGMTTFTGDFNDGSIDYSNVFVPMCDDDDGNGNTKTTITALRSGIKPATTQFVLNSNFSDDSSTTSYIYMPFNSISDTTSGQYYVHWAAPCTGRIKRIVMQHVYGSMSSSFTTQLQVYKNGSTFATSGELTASNGTSDGSYIEYNPSGSNSGNVSFVKGDRIRIRYSKSASSKYWRGVAASIIMELDQI